MASGYCSDCGQCVPITPGELHGGSGFLTRSTSSRRWYPSPHNDADGKPCDSKREAGNIEFAAHPSTAGRGVPQS